jgi:hypothetical protein
MSKAEVQTKRSRRWMLWLLSASVLLIGTVFAVLHFRAREWMRHIAVIESHGGTVSGYSNAPVWLQRFRSDEFVYFGDSYAETTGPDWLRRYLPTDTLLRCFDTVDHVELGHRFQLGISDPSPSASVLRHMEAFRHLKRLDLTNMEVDDSDVAGLRGLTNLRWLSLEGTSISDEGLKHLSKLTNLEELLLSHAEISNAGLKHLENLSELRRLDLADTNIADAGLVSIGHLRKLEVLVVRSTGIRGAGLSEWAPLQELKWLELSDCANVSDVDCSKLASLTKLRFLFVSGEDLTVTGVKPLKRLKELQAVDLWSPCPQVEELRRELSTIDVSHGRLFLGYEDLLSWLDDPESHGRDGLYSRPGLSFPGLEGRSRLYMGVPGPGAG